MKIDKESFNKLKQMDRIELLLKAKRIEDNNYNTNLSWATNLLFYIIMITLVGYIAFGLSFINRINIILRFSIYLISLGICIDIFLSLLFYIINSKKEKELMNEYFKIEVKK